MISRLHQVTLILSDRAFEFFKKMEKDYLDILAEKGTITFGVHPFYFSEIPFHHYSRMQHLSKNTAKRPEVPFDSEGAIIQWDWREWTERDPYYHIINRILKELDPAEFRYTRIGSSLEVEDVEQLGLFEVAGYHPPIGPRARWILETVPQVPTPRMDNCPLHPDQTIAAGLTMNSPYEVILALSPDMEELLQKTFEDILKEDGDGGKFDDYFIEVMQDPAYQIRGTEAVVRYWYCLYLPEDFDDLVGTLLDRIRMDFPPEGFRMIVLPHGDDLNCDNTPTCCGTFDKPVSYKVKKLVYTHPNPNPEIDDI